MIYKPDAPPGAAADRGGIARRPRHRARGRRAHLGRRAPRDRASAASCSAARRTPTCRSQDPNVSRRHAEVRQEGATYWLIDLDSTNGVEVRGKRVKRLKLEDGTRFTIGLDRDRLLPGARLVILLGPGRDDAPLPQDRLPRPPLPLHLADRPLRGARPAAAAGVDDPRAAAAAAAGLIPQPTARELGRLVVLASPALDEGDAYSLDAQPLTVGRGTNNDVPLPADEYASTRHARFEPRRDGVYIEDIGSTNGTFVNGIRLTRDRKLTPGRRRPHRRDRPEVRAVKIGRLRRADGHRAQAAPQRGRVRRRAAALRRRRRHGRRAGRRARLGRSRPPRCARRTRTAAASERVVGADPGGEPPRARARDAPTPPPRAWARR